MEPKQLKRKQSSYKGKGKYARTGRFLKLFVHKKHNNLQQNVSSLFKVAARLVPPNNSINKTLRSVHFGVVVVELIKCKCGGIVRNEIW